MLPAGPGPVPPTDAVAGADRLALPGVDADGGSVRQDVSLSDASPVGGHALGAAGGVTSAADGAGSASSAARSTALTGAPADSERQRSAAGRAVPVQRQPDTGHSHEKACRVEAPCGMRRLGISRGAHEQGSRHTAHAASTPRRPCQRSR